MGYIIERALQMFYRHNITHVPTNYSELITYIAWKKLPAFIMPQKSLSATI
jgi:hypothetical protein